LHHILNFLAHLAQILATEDALHHFYIS
jgi:hypothetical protein